jgi:hypothetical protein
MSIANEQKLEMYSLSMFKRKKYIKPVINIMIYGLKKIGWALVAPICNLSYLGS